MIEQDATVSQNYKRMAADALVRVFGKDDITTARLRDELVGPVRDALQRIYPQLMLRGLGDPLTQGTFKFDKGTAEDFDYKNLSGGEKAAFDLLLDIGVKRSAFPEAIYCIDEPETHMNSRLQGALLQELVDLVPAAGQLLISTHSIGMMRKAQELYKSNPANVAFIDFDQHDFDSCVDLKPSIPNRSFWERALHVALDDLAQLVSPREIVICEGHPSGLKTGKNVEHDAKCYNVIFGDEFPDVKFISVRNCADVASDRMGLLGALPQIANIAIKRLVDRDDHSPQDQIDLAKRGISTLGRRHIESYLYDDEILAALCSSLGKDAEIQNILADKAVAIANLALRQKPSDDIKSAAPEIYTKIKQRLSLTAQGNSQDAFARNLLVPLVKPGTATYAALKKDIFQV